MGYRCFHSFKPFQEALGSQQEQEELLGKELAGAQHQQTTPWEWSPFLPMQMPPEMQKVGLPAGRHRCPCSASCGQAPSCSSYHSELRFLVGWKGGRAERQLITPPVLNTGSTVQTHPLHGPPQGAACTTASTHTDTGEGKKPLSHMLTGRQQDKPCPVLSPGASPPQGSGVTWWMGRQRNCTSQK